MFSKKTLSDSEVYKLNEELVLKVFKKTNHGALKEESFIDKVGIKNETCVFPKFLAEYLNQNFSHFFSVK